MQRLVRTTLILLSLLVMSSCSIRRYVPEGKSLLLRNKIEITENYKELRRPDISKHVAQDAMPQLLGWMPMVNVYYRTEKKTDKKFYKWVNENIGNEPVYYNETSTFE